MISQLHIKNYALIEDLRVDFNSGLTTITGETGAGKSILLGGLSLVLGKRIDLSNIKDPSKKSIIECVFQLNLYNLNSFFKAHDLEYDSETIIRREILPSGKSRAFVYDSPVKLDVLLALGSRLVDIHSQHQTLSLTKDAFQFQIIDALAKTNSDLEAYDKFLLNHKRIEKDIEVLQFKKQQSKNEFDYQSFLVNELEASKVLEIDTESLESEFNTLSNIEDIQAELEYSRQLLNADEVGTNAHLISLKQRFQKLSELSVNYKIIYERIDSLAIELDDISFEIESKQNSLESDPKRLNEIEGYLKKIHDLFGKHSVNSMTALNAVYNALLEKTSKLGNYEHQLNISNDLLKDNLKKLKAISEVITSKRQ